jgi:hypothetical protein
MQSLRHVLWIGGSPGSGKTTVATRIARRHGLRWYNADARTWEHRDRAIRQGSAAAIRWERLSPAKRTALSPAKMLELSLHRERGPMVVDDLQALPRSPLVVAEGTTLPAAAVRIARAPSGYSRRLSCSERDWRSAVSRAGRASSTSSRPRPSSTRRGSTVCACWSSTVLAASMRR